MFCVICLNEIINVDPAIQMTDKNIRVILKHDEPVDTKSHSDTKSNSSLTLHSFDPNTISKAELESMNLPKKGIKSLLNYRQKGGQIKSVHDFKRMYGFEDLNDSLLEDHLYFTQHKQQYAYTKKDYDEPKKNEPQRTVISSSTDSAALTYKSKKFDYSPLYNRAPVKKLYIGINSADTSQLQQLKGIGPLRAKMIVKFREALGGYHSLSQLHEVHYLPDSVIQTISNQIFLDSIEIRKIKINRASQKDLSLHPYVNWKEAKMLFNYTKEHGPLTDFSALYNLRGLDSTFILRVKPYIDLRE